MMRTWFINAVADLRKRIQRRWTHGDPHAMDDKPYIMDELLRPSSWLAFGLYFVSMLLIIWIFSPPEWLALVMLCGFAVLGRALFKDVWVISSWAKPEKRLDGDE